MPNCPGAGSGDWRDYNQKSSEELRDDNIASAMRWIEKKGFNFVRIGVPAQGKYFVNYKITERHIEDCQFHWFVPDGNYITENDRKILRAEYSQLYGSLKEIPINFNGKYNYCIVERKKLRKSRERNDA